MVSPEEKLLRLIRGASKKPTAAMSSSPHGGSSTLPSGTSPSGQIRHPRPSSPRRLWALPARWLTVLNIVLGSVILVELLGGLWLMTKPVPTVTAPSAVLAQSPPGASLGPTNEPLPSVAAAITRPIFDTTSATTGISSQGAPVSDQAKTLAARLSLIGVVSGDPPQAIIEDTQTKKSYFVSAGQGVVEGLVVDQVLDNRVILDLRGEKIELSL